MPEVKLVAEVGRPIGSSAAGRLRASGKIPGIVYGHGSEPVPVAIEGRALRTVLTTEAGTNVLLNLDLAGRTELVITRAIQRDPVRHVVTHIDFQIVRRDEVVTSDVPVTLVGEATEVIKVRGVLDHELTALSVQSTPGRIPNTIEVDVSGLTVGDAVRVGELTLPDGVTTDVDPEHVVVVAQPPQVSELDVMTEAEQEQAAAEGEAAAATEAPAAGEAEAAPEAE